jgi:hypothetical protein
MRDTWKLPEPLSSPTIPWEKQMTLVGFNGSQVILVASEEGLYVCIASDEDDTTVRWICAPVLGYQFSLLIRGELSVRSIVDGTKGNLRVVDTELDEMTVRGEYVITRDCLNEAHLPEVDSFM